MKLEMAVGSLFSRKRQFQIVFDTREINDDSKPGMCCNNMQGLYWPQEELILGAEVQRDQAGAHISGCRERQRAAMAVLRREVCFYLTMH